MGWNFLAPGSTGRWESSSALLLIAFGAILAWAVNTNGGSVDPQVVGVILIVVGIIVFLISLVLWRTWWGAGFYGGWYDGPVDPRARGPSPPRVTARPGGEAHVRGGRAAPCHRRRPLL